MAYTVTYCDQFMDELLDKMGSDYFPLPIKLRRFESITLQFIRESTNFLETTQELSDDIVAWITSQKKTLSGGKNFRYMGKKFYRIEFPQDYLRFLNLVPMHDDSPIIGRNSNEDFPDLEIKTYRIGHFLMNERNPFRKAIGSRVNIYRMDDSILIDMEPNPYFNYVDFTYVRKPVFGKNPGEMILDCTNDILVDKLMHKTCVSLRSTSSDSDTQMLDDFVERQGQKIK